MMQLVTPPKVGKVDGGYQSILNLVTHAVVSTNDRKWPVTDDRLAPLKNRPRPGWKGVLHYILQILGTKRPVTLQYF